MKKKPSSKPGREVTGAPGISTPLWLSDEKTAEKLDLFAEFLLAENEKYNLTALKTPEAITLRHFCDSLTPVAHIKSGAKLLDIGSGAGFPAVPIALARPDVTVTGLDATAKKAAFINSAARG